MSLNRISFLEGWERKPAFLRGSEDSGSAGSTGPASDDSDVEEDLPESLSSSFPSTYSRLNFNPYAGPAWSEGDDRDDHSLASLSPTTTRDSRAGGWVGPVPVSVPVHAPAPASVAVPDPKSTPRECSETTGAFEVSPAKRVGMPNPVRKSCWPALHC